MPTIPETKTLSASVPEMLNAIRDNASSSYQERVPKATQLNLRDYGKAVMSYTATQNEFLDALVNRIARVIITSKSFSNPLRRFKKGIIEFGESIEEVFVNIARAHQFDPAVAETEVFKREIPDVEAVFHKMNCQNFYKVTISNDQLRQAFLSERGITDLIAKIVDTLYSGSEFDEFLIMKQLVSLAATQGRLYPVTIPEPTADNAKQIVTEIKAVSNMIEFPSTQYNAMGVLNFTPKSRQVLLINARFDAIMDVNVLASAFNMDKAEFMGMRVLVDDFGDTNAIALLVDEDWFMVFDNYQGFTENYNGQGLYWNYFYHAWKTFSTSPFSNAILFTTDATTITSVTVTPTQASIIKNGKLDMHYLVKGTGYFPQDVTWSISGTQPLDSTIDYKGLVKVGKNETNATLTVTATSTYDPTKSATATLTVTGN